MATDTNTIEVIRAATCRLIVAAMVEVAAAGT
jgi:hypothetical protein